MTTYTTNNRRELAFLFIDALNSSTGLDESELVLFFEHNGEEVAVKEAIREFLVTEEHKIEESSEVRSWYVSDQHVWCDVILSEKMYRLVLYFSEFSPKLCRAQNKSCRYVLVVCPWTPSVMVSEGVWERSRL